MHHFSELLNYGVPFTVQGGEDGIVVELCRRLEISDGCCVEFGAWDGVYLSNVWHFWHDRGWQALLIEPEPARYDELTENVKKSGNPRVASLASLVSHEGENSLNKIFARAGLRQDFELLSIDVDGNDYHIWKGLTDFNPKIVIVEYNPTFPPHFSFHDQPGSYKFGCSAKALVELGQEKGYSLAAVTGTNCTFVRTELFHKLNMHEPQVEEAQPLGMQKWLVSSYAGEPFLVGGPSHHSIDDRSFSGLCRQLTSFTTSTEKLKPTVVLSQELFAEVSILPREGLVRFLSERNLLDEFKDFIAAEVERSER